MKRLLCLFLLALLLCGCDRPETVSPSSEPTDPPPPKEVRVYLSDAACDKVTWRKVTDAFTATTGVRITAVSDPAQADVVHLYGDSAAEHLSAHPAAFLPGLPQTQIPGEEKTVADKILPGLLDSFAASPDGTAQFLPIFTGRCGLGYNAKLFSEKGWSIPATWEDLWILGDTAKAEGIYLLTYTDPAQLRELMYSTLYSVGGPAFFRDAAQYKEGIWTSDTGRACAQIMAKLASYTDPQAPSNIVAQCPEKNLSAWLDGQVLFFPATEASAPSLTEQDKPDDFQLSLAPIMSAEQGNYVYLSTHYIWISVQCENTASAVRFLAYLYSDIAADLFREAGLAQPIRGAEAIPSDLKFVAGSFRSYHAAVDAGSLRNIFLVPFGQMVNGTLTADEWIRNVETAITAIRASITN